MRGPTNAVVGAALLTALALAGCGSDAPAAQPVPRLAVKSDAVIDNYLESRYTCDGQDISPPIEWGAVPVGVRRLALFILAFKPEPATKTYQITVEWAVAGINPALHRLPAGELPRGAYIGLTNSHDRRRYSICPKSGEPVHYQFELYGEPVGLVPAANFVGLSALTGLNSRGATRALAHGGFVANYKRK